MLLAAFALAAAPLGAPVTLQGIGDIRIGMPLVQLRRLGAAQSHDYEPDEGVDCSYWSLPDRGGLDLMVSGGRVVRIDIFSEQYRTASGAGIGMAVSDVKSIYRGKLKVEPHPYGGPDDLYLVYRARAAPYGMMFETVGNQVHSFRVGLMDHVTLKEGCL